MNCLLPLLKSKPLSLHRNPGVCEPGATFQECDVMFSELLSGEAELPFLTQNHTFTQIVISCSVSTTYLFFLRNRK